MVKNFFAGFVEDVVIKFRRFNIFEVAIFEVCVLSFGMLLGLGFIDKIKKLKIVCIAGFVIAYMFLLFKFFILANDE